MLLRVGGSWQGTRSRSDRVVGIRTEDDPRAAGSSLRRTLRQSRAAQCDGDQGAHRRRPGTRPYRFPCDPRSRGRHRGRGRGWERARGDPAGSPDPTPRGPHGHPDARARRVGGRGGDPAPARTADDRHADDVRPERVRLPRAARWGRWLPAQGRTVLAPARRGARGRLRGLAHRALDHAPPRRAVRRHPQPTPALPLGSPRSPSASSTSSGSSPTACPTPRSPPRWSWPRRR